MSKDTHEINKVFKRLAAQTARWLPVFSRSGLRMGRANPQPGENTARLGSSAATQQLWEPVLPVRKQRAQSFVEFALVLPILLLILLGVVELTLFIGTYINLVDLTREAARFASNRDPFSPQGTYTCTLGNGKVFDFFYDTSCIFSPLETQACLDNNDTFCNGFNSTINLKPNEDDILIYVFTESATTVTQNGTPVLQPVISANAVCDVATAGGCIPWAWSNHDADTAHNDNWRRDCDTLTTPATAAPNFTPAIIQSYLQPTAMPDKGFVVVEVIYCYQQVLNIPILSNFLPNPIKIDTYSIMPLPAAQPTPIPTP